MASFVLTRASFVRAFLMALGMYAAVNPEGAKAMFGGLDIIGEWLGFLAFFTGAAISSPRK